MLPLVFVVLAFAAALFVASAGKAGAQELATIVVTAQKRPQNEMKVPISLSVVQANEITNLHIAGLYDLSSLVPGLNVSTTGPGQYTVGIRGLSGSPGFTAGVIGYYLDNIPIPSAIDAGLFDLARVEVLRGPQGTLYGSSSMGGTIRYISKPANPNFVSISTNASFGIMNGGGTGYKYGATLNLPLSGTSALRIVAIHKSTDGFINRYAIPPNNLLGVDISRLLSKDTNAYRLDGVRATLLWHPMENLKIEPSVFYQKTKLNGQYTIDVPPGNSSNILQARDLGEPYTDRVALANLTLNWKIATNLIGVMSESFTDRRISSTEDYSRIWADLFPPQPVIGIEQFTTMRTKTTSTEARVRWEPGRWRIIAGLYASHINYTDILNNPTPTGYNQNPNIVTGPISIVFYSDSVQTTDELSEFSNIQFDATKKLTLSVGFRHYQFNQHLTGNAGGFFNGGPTSVTGKTANNGVSPSFNVSYKLTPRTLAYATVSRGFRAGGLEPYAAPQGCLSAVHTELGLANAPTAYNPDHVWNYELGTKWISNSRRISASGDVYYIQWNQMQQNIGLSCGYSFLVNFGNSVSKGAEFQASWAVSDSVTVHVEGAYTDATLSNNEPGTSGGQSGDPLINTPKFAGSITATLRQPISSRLDLIGAASFSHTGWEATTYDKSVFYYKRPGYDLIRAEVGIEPNDKDWRAVLYADNLTDFRGDTGLYTSETGTVVPNFTRVGTTKPRTIGLEVFYKFKQHNY